MKDKQYKAIWQTFKDNRIEEYVELHHTVNQNIKPNNHYYLMQVATAMAGKRDLAHLLKEMDKLDGTNEFSNLFSDLEDE